MGNVNYYSISISFKQSWKLLRYLLSLLLCKIQKSVKSNKITPNISRKQASFSFSSQSNTFTSCLCSEVQIRTMLAVTDGQDLSSPLLSVPRADFSHTYETGQQNLAEVSMWSVKFLSVMLTIRDSILFGPHIHPVTYNKTLVLEMPSPSFYCLSYWVLVQQDAVRKKKKSHVSETLQTIPHS